MKYFEVAFPNHVILIVKTKNKSLKDVVIGLGNAYGIESFSDAILNPTHFISVNSISSPDKTQELVALDLEEVLF